MWQDVVLQTRLTPALAPTTVAPNPFAAYRAPWHTPLAPAVAAVEADLADFVVPPSSLGPVWSVYRELSTVDVLLHHRDSRAATAGRAWAMLLYRTAPSLPTALASPVAGVVAYRAAARGGAPNVAPPAGWTAVRNGTASRFSLATDLTHGSRGPCPSTST